MSGEGFFQFHQRVKGAKSPASPSAPPGEGPMTVSRLTALIEAAIASSLPASVAVRGEVSNARGRQASGHLYFTLKDDAACINCVMWRDAASRLKFRVEDGMELVASGRVAVYAPQGKYQLQVSSLQPVGRGALELALRQLQARLAAEGLFATERKKPIPPYPRRIVMITSRSTAALQDMLKVLRRFSWLKLMLYHVPVQGEGSAEKIAAAIDHLNRCADRVGGADVILLARGGGSLEDLWAFNEEVVARAVAASRIPIVTGIGHEIDCTIADLVADHHAHTPTEAAQTVVQHWKRAAEELGYGQTRMNRSVRQILQDARQRLAAAARHEMFRRPLDRIQQRRQLLDDRQRSVTLAMAGRLRDAGHALATAGARLEKCHPRHPMDLGRQRMRWLADRLRSAGATRLRMLAGRLEVLDGQLAALSPAAVLGRGYSITSLKNGQIVRSVAQLQPGARILTRLRDGQSESIVQDTRQLLLFE